MSDKLIDTCVSSPLKHVKTWDNPSLQRYSTADLVAELKTRPHDELHPRPFCLYIASTVDLVNELASRDGDAIDVFQIKQHFRIEQCFADDMSISWSHVCAGRGPCKIIVVVD